MGLVAFNRVHPFFTSPSEIFQAPYAGTIETLLNGDHTFQQLADGTPAQLSELLTPRGYALLRHPTGGLATALRIDSSVCDWTPRVPVRLYYATGDEQAVNANTFHCQPPSPPTARQSPRSTWHSRPRRLAPQRVERRGHRADRPLVQPAGPLPAPLTRWAVRRRQPR